MALDWIPHGADEICFIHQREHRLRFGRGYQFGFHAEITALRVGEPQEIHALRGVGHHDAAGQMQAAGLAGKLLDLLVELDRVGLQFRDVGVAVQRMETAGGVPGRARCQLRPLDQKHVGPAGSGEVKQNGAADNAAADDYRFNVRFHVVGSMNGEGQTTGRANTKRRSNAATSSASRPSKAPRIVSQTERRRFRTSWFQKRRTE